MTVPKLLMEDSSDCIRRSKYSWNLFKYDELLSSDLQLKCNSRKSKKQYLTWSDTWPKMLSHSLFSLIFVKIFSVCLCYNYEFCLPRDRVKLPESHIMERACWFKKCSMKSQNEDDKYFKKKTNKLMLIIDHKRVKTKNWSKIKQTGESQGIKEIRKYWERWIAKYG